MSSTGHVHAGLVHGFVKAIVVIIVSEIGDKTFFIAAIFAMKHPRSTVFAGAIGALGLMTFLSGMNLWFWNSFSKILFFC